jgi:thiosulfate dehydrogenase (quinone) large subunit
MLGQRSTTTPMRPEEFQDPRWARFLFASSSAAWIWLLVRLYMAYVYLPAGWSKITSGKWLFGDGAPIMGLVNGAISSDGTPGWYVWFLQNVVTPLAGLFATLVALGEFAIGLGLLVGLLTGIAGFFAAFVSGNFVLAGALGSNPLLVIFGVLLALAWKNAGWIGLDRYLIPWAHKRFWTAPSEPAPGPERATTTT